MGSKYSGPNFQVPLNVLEWVMKKKGIGEWVMKKKGIGELFIHISDECV